MAADPRIRAIAADRRVRLAAGVVRRRELVTWNDTIQDLGNLVSGRLRSRTAA